MASSPPPAALDGANGTASVLRAAMDLAGLDAAAQRDVIAWLGEQLADERYAQLDRAGHDASARIPLARVLIDLPIRRSAIDGGDDARAEKEVLAALCAEDPELFEPLPGQAVHAVIRASDARLHAPRAAGSEKAGIVLTGGPGQGKSTITQCLAAIHRAALLAPHGGALDPQARDALDAIHAAQQRAEEAPRKAALPGVEKARFVLRISLPEAAAWLLEQGDTGASSTPALIRFVAERAARQKVSADGLAALAAHVDWLVILDALDEVPASEARARVLAEARALVDDLHARRPGGLVVATTRPQGYGGELDGWTGLQTWHLVDLDVTRAQRYARQLVEARYEAKRGERILARLAEAAAASTAARLFRSPLQVTILVALIARIGRAPGERWSLFSEYYRIIYEREIERDHPAAELLRRYRSLIDRIHMHVGLLLQAESEQAAGSGSTMSTARLRDVMHVVLADQGMDVARRQPIVDDLIAALTERLVLLVERRPGQVGFEIRPLQELMAAWALAQKETMSEARLLRVARSDAFREVVLFLASKAFAGLSEVRDVLVDRVLPALNDDPDEPTSRYVLRGSVLAIEVLEDGAALSQPKYVEKLAALGARLLDLPLSPLLPRLARVCLSDADGAAAAVPVLMKAIREKLDAGGAWEERLSAWALLISLADGGSEQAVALADERGSTDEALPRGLLYLLKQRKFAYLGRSFRTVRAEAWGQRATLIEAARENVGKTPSGLEDPAVWDELQLPMPRPERRSPSDRAPASPAERRPVVIDEIVLRNFRGIKELTIEPSPPQNGHGQWLVLLGKNGLGKTTVLRALALSLFDIDDPVRRPLPPTAYTAKWRRIGSPEGEPTFVRVRLRGHESALGAQVRPREDLMALEQLAPMSGGPDGRTSRAPNEIVLVYGARRRYLVSDLKRPVVPELYTLVPSLFEEGADLLPIEESLRTLETAWHNAPESVKGRLHVELRAALTKLLRVDAIETRGSDLWVRSKSTGEVPLKELSDGYLMLASWVVDLVVRWWHQANLWKITPSSPILRFMTGLVIVDEIDLFLHPDWQRSVVRTLKETFPRMSFVVTTHDPLAILGASAAEIRILRRDERGTIHADQRTQEPFQLTGSDLYDLYFGVESVLPDEHGEKMRRYRQIAGDPFRTPEQDAEARRLLGDLRAAGFDPGWEPVALVSRCATGIRWSQW